MNKTNLYKEVKEIVSHDESEKYTDCTIKDASVFVEATLKAMFDALVAGEKITLAGFGSFELAERGERMGRNPRTGEECLIPASKAVKFKASKAMKDAVNA